jgi:demethylmenaquinone methyltransferase/2-methoxy-6-polyprenyl-1,4-benzoquinol methylase
VGPAKASRKLPDDFYDRIRSRLHRRIGRELRLAQSVLDLGCGGCELVEYLADRYGQDVTGVDLPSRSFPARRRSRRGARFHCYHRDAARLRFARTSSVDAVVMVWSLHEMDRPAAVLREVRRVLRPGGEALVVDFPRNSLAQRLWNEDYYRQREVSRLLEGAGLCDVRTKLIEHEQVIWATAHEPMAGAA